MKIKNFRQGFTLIELMIVITVIAILSAIVLFGLGAAQKNARDVQRIQIVKAVQNYLQAYASGNNGSYPTGSGVWTALFGSGNPLELYATTALNDPNCGTGTAIDVRNNAAPCGTVTYSYTATGTGNCSGTYMIVLGKEAGSSQTFCGPK